MTEEALFAAALAKPAAERAAFLDEACAGDAALRARVEALLRSHEGAGRFLEQPAAEQVAARPPGNLTGATSLSPAAGGAVTRGPTGGGPAETRAGRDGGGGSAEP